MKAGLARKVNSLRKFFRTQLTALGVHTDYVEYMMGHKISTYHDVNFKFSSATLKEALKREALEGVRAT